MEATTNTIGLLSVTCAHYVEKRRACGQTGTHFCWHCKRSLCEEHVRLRHMPFSSYPIGYCVACDAGIASGHLHG